MDRVNLHGVDLQRAIAERKGWTLNPDAISSVTHDAIYYRVIDLPAAHALLGELAEKGWEWQAYQCGKRLTAISVEAKRQCEVDAPDFCTAVGNLWLECVG